MWTRKKTVCSTTLQQVAYLIVTADIVKIIWMKAMFFISLRYKRMQAKNYKNQKRVKDKLAKNLSFCSQVCSHANTQCMCICSQSSLLLIFSSILNQL